MSLSLAVVILLFLICLFVLFIVSDMVFEDKDFSFDEKVFAALQTHVNPSLTSVIRVITFFGSHQFLLPANLLLIAYFLFVKKNKRVAIHITTVSVVSLVVLFLLKDILRRERPMVPLIAKVHGYSFPSGHTLSSVTFYGMLMYIAWKNMKNSVWKWITVGFLFIIPFLIGFSRIYLRVHYASDVIAGLCVGIIWLLLAKWLLLTRRFDPTKKLMPDPAPGQSNGNEE